MITRRTLGKLSVALPVLGIDRSAIAKAKPLYDLNDRFDYLEAYAKVRASLDGSVRYYHYVAEHFSLPEKDIPAPLFRREGVSACQFRINPDRTLEGRLTQCNYTIDDNGRPIDVWHNPLTGSDVKVVNQAPGLRAAPTIHYGADSVSNPSFAASAGSRQKYMFHAPLVREDRVFFTDDMMLFRDVADEKTVQLAVPRPGTFRFIEAVTYQSSLTDIQNSTMMSVPTTCTVAAVVPWMPWMGMDDRSGGMLLRYLSYKVESISRLPSWLVKRIEQDHPTLLTDPFPKQAI